MNHTGQTEIGGDRITVVLPVYNGMPYLPAAVNSILSQSFRNFRLIVLNDASTDGTRPFLDSIADPRVTVVHSDRQGHGALLNRGIAMSMTDYIARMDADDISEPDRFEKQIELLEASPDAIACGCQLRIIDQHDAERQDAVYPTTRAGTRFLMLTHTPLPHPGVMMRREAVLQAGGYDQTMVPIEDLDLWWRMRRLGELINHPDRLLKYRIHSSNVSVSRREEQARRRHEYCVARVYELGISASAEEAADFLVTLRQLHGEFGGEPPRASGRFLRVLSRYCSTHASATDAAEIRAELQWKALRNAAACGPFASSLAWRQLAVRVDSRGLLHRAGRKALRLIGAGN